MHGFAWVLYMRSWMIGIPAGVFAASWSGQLPDIAVLAWACLLTLLLRNLLLRTHPHVWLVRNLSALMIAGLMGLGWGLYWGETAMNGRLPTFWEGEILTVEGRVASLPAVTRGRRPIQRFVFDVERVICPRVESVCPQKLGRVRLNYYEWGQLHPGDRWRFRVKLKRPRGLYNPGTFDYEAWLHSKGIQATGYVRREGQTRLNGEAERWWQRGAYLHHQIRASLRDSFLRSHLPVHEAGTLAALTIGDRSLLTTDAENLYQTTGTGHLVVISGLHVGLVAAAAFFFGRLLCVPLLLLVRQGAAQDGALIFSFFTAFIYAALAGFSLPTVRALVMLGVIQFALLQRRSTIQGYGFGMALVIVSILDPMASHSPGFWLSFGAVTIILISLSTRVVLLEPRENQDSVTRQIKVWMRIQWWLWLLMMPVLVVWFTGFSVVAPLANAVAIPLIGSLVVPLTLAGAALMLCDVSWAVILWDMAAQLLLATEFVLRWLSENSPLSPWWPMGTTPVIATLGVMGMLMLLLPVKMPTKLLGLFLVFPLTWYRAPGIPAGQLRMTVLDVGQGMAVWVQAGNQHLLYDAGPSYSSGFDTGSAVVVPYLRYQGVHDLDLKVLSHGDRDHAGGMGAVHEAFPSSLLAGEPAETAGTAAQCRAGESWNWSGVHFQILHPSVPFIPHGGNNASCVLRIEAGNTRILLTGDIEREAELDMLNRYADTELLDVDLLLVPHHGSKTSSIPAFVHATSPDLAIVASGYRNRFGHPHPDVVGRYNELGTEMYEVSRSGAIEISVNVRGLEVMRSRDEANYYWRE